MRIVRIGCGSTHIHTHIQAKGTYRNRSSSSLFSGSEFPSRPAVEKPSHRLSSMRDSAPVPLVAVDSSADVNTPFFVITWRGSRFRRLRRAAAPLPPHHVSSAQPHKVCGLKFRTAWTPWSALDTMALAMICAIIWRVPPLSIRPAAWSCK